MTNAHLYPGITSNLVASKKSLHDHWRLYVVEGFILIALGAAAMIVPLVASLAIENLLGWVFFIGGVVGIVTTTIGRYAPGFWWSLLSAILAVVVGSLLIGWPMHGVMSLTFILTCYLIADGVLMLLYAFEHHRQLSQRAGWLAVNGILDLVLAGIIATAMPTSVAWVLGMIVGLDMLFGGFSLIAMAFTAHDAVDKQIN